MAASQSTSAQDLKSTYRSNDRTNKPKEDVSLTWLKIRIIRARKTLEKLSCSKNEFDRDCYLNFKNIGLISFISDNSLSDKIMNPVFRSQISWAYTNCWRTNPEEIVHKELLVVDAAITCIFLRKTFDACKSYLGIMALLKENATILSKEETTKITHIIHDSVAAYLLIPIINHLSKCDTHCKYEPERESATIRSLKKLQETDEEHNVNKFFNLFLLLKKQNLLTKINLYNIFFTGKANYTTDLLLSFHSKTIESKASSELFSTAVAALPKMMDTYTALTRVDFVAQLLIEDLPLRQEYTQTQIDMAHEIIPLDKDTKNLIGNYLFFKRGEFIKNQNIFIQRAALNQDEKQLVSHFNKTKELRDFDNHIAPVAAENILVSLGVNPQKLGYILVGPDMADQHWSLTQQLSQRLPPLLFNKKYISVIISTRGARHATLLLIDTHLQKLYCLDSIQYPHDSSGQSEAEKRIAIAQKKLACLDKYELVVPKKRGNKTTESQQSDALNCGVYAAANIVGIIFNLEKLRIPSHFNPNIKALLDSFIIDFETHKGICNKSEWVEDYKKYFLLAYEEARLEKNPTTSIRFDSKK